MKIARFMCPGRTGYGVAIHETTLVIGKGGRHIARETAHG